MANGNFYPQIMITKWNATILKIIETEIGSLEPQSSLQYIKYDSENGLNLRYIVERIYLTSVL